MCCTSHLLERQNLSLSLCHILGEEPVIDSILVPTAAAKINKESLSKQTNRCHKLIFMAFPREEGLGSKVGSDPLTWLIDFAILRASFCVSSWIGSSSVHTMCSHTCTQALILQLFFKIFEFVQLHFQKHLNSNLFCSRYYAVY